MGICLNYDIQPNLALLLLQSSLCLFHVLSVLVRCSILHCLHSVCLFHQKITYEFRYIRYIGFFLWSSALKLAKKFNSTSFNLKQEVFIRRDEEKTRRGLVFIGEWTWHLFLIKEVELWRLIFTPFQVVKWSLISVMWCGELLQLSPTHVDMFVTLLGRWRNDTTQFMSGDKELGLVWSYVANNSIDMTINWTGF